MVRRCCANLKDDQREQENMEVESCGDQNRNSNGSETSASITLMANNRALAAALAEAQQQVRSLHQENINLKKQICDNHLNFVEKSSKLEKQVKSVEYLSKEAQVVFSKVYNLLSQSSAFYVQGTNSLSDAVNLVSSSLSKVDVMDNSEQYMEPPEVKIACTTPPPDEPTEMEFTASQSVVIETFDPAMTGDPLIQSKQPDVDDDGMSLDIMTQELATRRSKRKSCTGVSYTEPGLRNKLRRGDPFTDTKLFGVELVKDNRKKKKNLKRSASLPGMSNNKKRAPLNNLTNIIREEN